MIALINFGPNAPTHPELDTLMQSCGCDSWEHAMISTKDKNASQLAWAAAQFAYDVVLAYYTNKAAGR